MSISKSPIITPLPQSQPPIRTQNPQYQIYNPNNYPLLEQPQKPPQKKSLKPNKNFHSPKAQQAHQPPISNKQKSHLSPNMNQQSYTYTIAELPSLQHTHTHSHAPRTSVSNSPSPHHSTLYRSKSPSYLHICHPSHLSNSYMNPITKSQIKAFSNQIQKQQGKKQKEMQRKIQEFQKIQEEIYNMKENTIYKSKEPLIDMTKQEIYFGLYAAKGKWNKLKESRVQGKGGKEYQINFKEANGGNQIQNERDTGRFNNIRKSKQSVQQYQQQILNLQKQYNRLRSYLSQLQQQIRSLKQQNSKLTHKLSMHQSKSNKNSNNHNKQLKSPLPLPSSAANQSQTDLSLQKILSNINTNIYDGNANTSGKANGKQGNQQGSPGPKDTKHYFQEGRIDQDIVRSLTVIGNGNNSLYSDNIQLLKLAKQEIIQRDTKIHQLESKLSYISQTITSPHSSPSPFPDLQSQLLTLSSSLQRSFSQQLLLKQKIKILEQKLKNIIEEVKEIQSRSLRQEKEILEKEIQMEMEVRYMRGLVALDREKDGNADWGEISDHGDKDERIMERKKSNTYAYPLAPSESPFPKKIWFNRQDSNPNLNQLNASTPQHSFPFSPNAYSYANTNIKKSSTEVTQYSGYNGYTFRKIEGQNAKQRQGQK